MEGGREGGREGGTETEIETGKERETDRERLTDPWLGPQRAPLGDTVRKACISATWQHVPRHYFRKARRAFMENRMKSSQLK